MKNKTEKKIELKDLEGKELTWRHGKYGENESKEYKAKLALADYDLGFTIVKADDPDYELTCFHGKHSKYSEKYRGKKAYDAEIKATIKMIQNDTYNVVNCPGWKKNMFNLGPMVPCAFK